MSPEHKSETQALPALERFLTYRLHLVNKLSDRDTYRACQDELELPLGEARCLAAIGRFAPLSIKDLARAANLDKGQASRSARSLVERGMVNKTASESDARGVLLTVTPADQEKFGQILDTVARHLLAEHGHED